MCLEKKEMDNNIKDKKDSYDAVVFAGGGCRCFWQLGFWSVVAPEPKQVAAVSAGSAMALAALLGRGEKALHHFKAVSSLKQRHFYPENLLVGQPIYDYYNIYRESILYTLGHDGVSLLKAGPELRVMIVRPPVLLGCYLSLLLGLGCHLIEKNTSDPVHPRLARLVGFRHEMVVAQNCNTAGEIADLLLASSSTPPFTPILRWDRRLVIDGSLMESGPVDILDKDLKRVLVLLSRDYGSRPPLVPGRVYVAPSRPLPIRMWDYSNPNGVQAAYDIGCEDGEAFLRGKLSTITSIDYENSRSGHTSRAGNVR